MFFFFKVRIIFSKKKKTPINIHKISYNLHYYKNSNGVENFRIELDEIGNSVKKKN